MADILHTLSIISYILAVLFVVLAIVLWFIFKIPNVIGDLSGRNAKKSIARMRQNNEKTGDKSYRASEKNLARGHDEQATGLLLDDATGLLDESGETAALKETVDVADRAPSTVVIHKIEEVILIHTEEVI